MATYRALHFLLPQSYAQAPLGSPATSFKEGWSLMGKGKSYWTGAVLVQLSIMPTFAELWYSSCWSTLHSRPEWIHMFKYSLGQQQKKQNWQTRMIRFPNNNPVKSMCNQKQRHQDLACEKPLMWSEWGGTLWSNQISHWWSRHAGVLCCFSFLTFLSLQQIHLQVKHSFSWLHCIVNASRGPFMKPIIGVNTLCLLVLYGMRLVLSDLSES